MFIDELLNSTARGPCADNRLVSGANTVDHKINVCNRLDEKLSVRDVIIVHLFFNKKKCTH